jgi:hypothetical protein
MAQKQDIGFEVFYQDICGSFPQIKILSTWVENNWKEEPFWHSAILSDIAREMIVWAKASNWKDVERLLAMVEVGFTNGDQNVQAYLGTDFTVTITECDDRPVREKIKEMFLPATAEAYRMNLRGYREPN